MKLFTGYAKQGGASFKVLNWKPIEKADLPNSYKGLLIEQEGNKVDQLPESHRIAVWDSIFPEGVLY